jgi:plastocyanin
MPIGRNVVVALALTVVADAASAGTVRGKVWVARPGAAPAPLPVTKDGDTCGREVADESLLISGGRLANVVVTLRGLPAPPPARLTLGQERCRFVPHVQVAPVGSTLEIVNGDPVLHNVHGWAGHASRFNVPTPVQGARIPTKLDRAGLIQVRCDVHGWMSAYVWVVDAPAAVTGRDGTFTLSGVPAGTYTVTAWHERMGERTLQVTVPAQGDVSVEIAY